MRSAATDTALGLVGAAIGGAVGFALFWFILTRYRMYGLILPGALLGLGCDVVTRRASLTRGIVCGVAALVVASLAEWRFFPFAADPGLRYFVTHLHHLSALTWFMIGLGGIFAFYWGWGRGKLPVGRGEGGRDD